jgi:hypothetical protein
LIQMKDLALGTWEREGWRMFKARAESKPDEASDELSTSA